jgi:ribosome-associated translation inhibitor RaiA
LQIETRNLGVSDDRAFAQEISRALGAALDRFGDRIPRARVRLALAGNHDAVCRVRIWCGKGATVVVEESAATSIAAVYAAADTLKRALRRRWSSRRSRRRHASRPGQPSYEESSR